MKTMHRILAFALVSAALLIAAPSARADDLPWVYNDNGSANRTPSVGTSATWTDLFHWEVFTALAQTTVCHFPGTVLFIK